MKCTTPQHVIDDIKDQINAAGSQIKLADMIEEEAPHIGAWIKGTRAIPDRALKALGWKREIVYTRIEK